MPGAVTGWLSLEGGGDFEVEVEELLEQVFLALKP